jgi:ribosome-binding factor A
VSALTEKEVEAGLATLNRAKGFLRSELGKRLSLRRTPELQFLRDRSLEHGLRVAELLQELEQKGELDGTGEEE